MSSITQIKSKKTRKWEHPIRDKLEDVFCINNSSFVRPAYTFSEGDKEKGIAKLVETQKYNFGGKKLTQEYLEDKVIINIRPNKKIKAFALDIDTGSKYRNDYVGIIECLEDIGFCRCNRVISSKSGGLHLWFPLKVALNSRFLHLSIKAWLEDSGFEISEGTLEIFPGRGETTYKKGDRGNWEVEHLARCFRLPLQSGSYVIDEDENIIHNDKERFWLSDFDWCADGQDYDSIDAFQRAFEVSNSGSRWENDMLVPEEEEAEQDELERLRYEVDAPDKPKKKKRGRISRVQKEQEALNNKVKELGVSRDRYISTLRAMIKEGWTDSSQSNYLIGAVAVVASYENRHLDDAALAKSILWEVKRMPGYDQYASAATKKDLEKSGRDSWARRWAKSVVKYRKKVLGID